MPAVTMTETPWSRAPGGRRADAGLAPASKTANTHADPAYSMVSSGPGEFSAKHRPGYSNPDRKRLLTALSGGLKSRFA
jgi:hypothetical protein